MFSLTCPICLEDDINAAWYDANDKNPPTSKQMEDFIKKGNANANVKYFG